MLEKTNLPPIIIVAGVGRNTRAIGKNDKLLWHVPADLKRFKALTLGHPIIMGRKTFESIIAMLGKPLPGRTNIVLTRDTSYQPTGARVAHSLESALLLAQDENPQEIHIGGGAELYRQVLPLVSRLHITWFEDTGVEGDTFFPEFENEFEIIEQFSAQEYQDIKFQWVDYKRKE
jgi:dihydrofolate reductase